MTCNQGLFSTNGGLGRNIFSAKGIINKTNTNTTVPTASGRVALIFVKGPPSANTQAANAMGATTV